VEKTGSDNEIVKIFDIFDRTTKQS